MKCSNNSVLTSIDAKTKAQNRLQVTNHPKYPQSNEWTICEELAEVPSIAWVSVSIHQSILKTLSSHPSHTGPEAQTDSQWHPLFNSIPHHKLTQIEPATDQDMSILTPIAAKTMAKLSSWSSITLLPGSLTSPPCRQIWAAIWSTTTTDNSTCRPISGLPRTWVLFYSLGASFPVQVYQFRSYFTS